MPRIVNCPGSVNICKRFPQLSTDIGEESKKGILAYWLFEQISLHKIDPWKYLNKTPINDQIIDSEMINHINNFYKIIKIFGAGKIKQRLEILKGEFIGFGGTPCFIFYNKSLCKLIIIDLKYGFLPVSVFENWQLLSYGWIFCKTNPDLLIKSIEFGIYQPRMPTKDGIYKIWKISFSDIQKYEYFSKIQKTLRFYQSEYSIIRTGYHCHNCHAILQCDNNLQTCLKIVNLGSMQYGEEPTGEQLSSQLKLFQFAMKILKKRLQVIESVTQVRLESGKSVPGYHLEVSKGNRYWDVSPKRAKRIGIPEQISKLMTPRQAELEGFPANLIDKYTKIKTSFKLAETDIDQINERLKQ